MTTPLSIIDRRYSVLRLLGSGLSGEIYEVQGPEGVVALKLLKSQVPGLNQEDLVTNFRFEFTLLKGLTHPNVIRIFDFGYDEALKRFYFTEELSRGVPFPQALPELGVDDLQKLFIQALQGLAYLHGQDVLHGDLKPENLLIETTPELKLKMIDFGISHPAVVRVAGTPPYLAPEKILKEQVDARSDLYSLAVMFYSLLVGSNPFLGENVAATLRAHLHVVPPNATMLRPEVDPVWSELLAQMLRKKPYERPASAMACLKFLESRGAQGLTIRGPHFLPRHWLGRAEILQKAQEFLGDVLLRRPPKILALSGEEGVGKSTLMTELKYECELRKIHCRAWGEAAPSEPEVLFLSAADLRRDEVRSWLLRESEHTAVILEWGDAWASEANFWLPDSRTQWLKLRPFTFEETGHYLREATLNTRIPEPFQNALHRYSGGYPAQLHEMLRSLLKDPDLVEASGRWNLSVFQEVEPSLEQLGLSKKSLAHLIAQDISDQERWALELRQCLVLGSENLNDEALALLNRLEKQIAKFWKGAEKLEARSRLLEKRGWIYTRTGRYSEAREAFASGLSLLRESELANPVLELRLRNFLAFLDLQEGRSVEAVKQFEETAESAALLSAPLSREVTNNELGSAYLASGQLEAAVRRLEEDVLFFAGLPDPIVLMKTQYNLAEAYVQAQRLSEAAASYERVAEIARRERRWDYLLRAYNGLGNLASLQGDPLRSLDYYQRSFALAEYRRDYLSAATVAQNRGVILHEAGRLHEALQDLESSKRLLSKVSSSSQTRYLMARATLELGEVYVKQGDLGKARGYFTEALNRAEEDSHLKSFSFYPLASLAQLALRENDRETFQEWYPRLVHLATGEAEQKILARIQREAALPQVASPSGASNAEARRDLSETLVMNEFPQEALYSILKINRALLTETDFEKLLEKILQYATELSGAESALLLELSEDNQLALRGTFNLPADSEAREISQQVARRVLETGSSLVTHDALHDEHLNQFQSVVALQLRSIACIPIHLHHKVIGLLYLTHRNQSELFRRDVVSLLEAFADQAGLALQNLRNWEALKRLNEQLQSRLENAESLIDQLKTDLRQQAQGSYPKILGKSPAMRGIFQHLDRISDTNLSVLILGETGTGKELVARALHENSRRASAPFVAVNCGAIPENLLESELFGYVAGAFTGAVREKKGLIETANGGTLFLDEVADLPLNMQVKLLRVLQEREVLRVGATKPTPVDIRVVTATHRDLDARIEQGQFREDLYYRIASMVLQLPSLTERLEDLTLLVAHFLKATAAELGIEKVPTPSKDLLAKMMSYRWPGNVRELENMIRTACAFAVDGVVRFEDLPEFLRKRLQTAKSKEASVELRPISDFTSWKWKQYEEALFAKALIASEMDFPRAAGILGVGVATVYLKIRHYGLKERLEFWRGVDLGFLGLETVMELKRRLIREFYARYRSPNEVARQLGMNVATVQRYLNE